MNTHRPRWSETIDGTGLPPLVDVTNPFIAHLWRIVVALSIGGMALVTAESVTDLRLHPFLVLCLAPVLAAGFTGAIEVLVITVEIVVIGWAVVPWYPAKPDEVGGFLLFGIMIMALTWALQYYRHLANRLSQTIETLQSENALLHQMRGDQDNEHEAI